MLLKTIILILLAGLLISLGSGLIYLFKDVGTTRRTLNSLGVRITLAAALMGTIGYGIYTGQLANNAPWDARKMAQGQVQAGSPPAPNSQDINENKQADPDNINKVPVP